MKTVFIDGNYKSSAAYMDYAILYRMAKGNTFRSLGLLAFCRKIENGYAIKIGDVTFIKK